MNLLERAEYTISIIHYIIDAQVTLLQAVILYLSLTVGTGRCVSPWRKHVTGRTIAGVGRMNLNHVGRTNV